MPKKLEITFDMAKNLANERFNGKYSYDKFSFKNMTTKSTITCPKHGDFEMTIEEIKGNKYNIWNCGFIKFKADFSF